MISVWFHKTQGDGFAPAPFIHVGTVEQAKMRGAIKPVIMRLDVDIEPHKLIRRRDHGQWDIKKLKALERRGYDGVVYLNRFEGIPLHEFDHARKMAGDIDRLADGEFLKLIPSAKDSLIIFDPMRIKAFQRLDAPPREHIGGDGQSPAV